MFFSRSLLSLFLALSAFFLFSSATPLAEIAPRAPKAEPHGLSLDIFAGLGLGAKVGGGSVGTCSTAGCSEQSVLDIVAQLQAAVDAKVSLLDGKTTPGPIITDICASIKVAIQALLKVKVCLSTAGTLIDAIVKIIVQLCVCLSVAIGKYGILVTLALSAKLDLSLASFIGTVCTTLPYLKVLLSAGLKVNVDLLASVKLVLTLAACGLSI